MNRDDAFQLVCEYTASESLRRHMLAVEAAMRAYAREFGAEEDTWGIVGLLHDFDYERWPDPPDHPLKGSAILAELGYPQEVIYAIKSHADYLEECPRVSLMDKSLYACDELAGFITAVALMRPEKIEGMTAKSVKKKMKQKGFAAAVNRDDIVRGAEDLGVDLTEHIQRVIDAMAQIAPVLGLTHEAIQQQETEEQDSDAQDSNDADHALDVSATEKAPPEGESSATCVEGASADEPLRETAGPTDSAASATLQAALDRYEVELPPEYVSRIEDYTRVLWQWNENLNLTRHTTYDLFVARDLLDSLRLAELLEPGETVLDVGTGGGVPGVILAIVRPDLEVALCESVAKRARAVDDMVGQLGLSVPVHAMRAEELLTSISFGTLVLRAVAPLPKMLNWFRGRFSSVGRLLIIKGPAWVEERGEARHRGLLAGLRLRVVSRYPIPGRDSESVILEIRPESSD